MPSLMDAVLHKREIDPVMTEAAIERGWVELEIALTRAEVDVEAKLAEVARVELEVLNGETPAERLVFLAYLRRASKDVECLALAPVTVSVCDRCDGSGWVDFDDAGTAVFPCLRCRPDLFRRWSGGHLRHDHDKSSCTECLEVARKAELVSRGARGGRRPTASETAEEADERAVQLEADLF